MNKTKQKFCTGTPYSEASIALDAASADRLELFKAAALKEVEFLESLLPQPKKTERP